MAWPEGVSKFAEIWVITDGGPWAEHNYPCPVCGCHKAVLYLNDGVMLPCDECSKTWELRRKPWWRRKR